MTLTRTYRMPLGFEVEFTFGTSDTGAGCFAAEWSPRTPKRLEIRKLIDAYREARSEFVRELAQRTGLRVGVVEV